MICRYLYVRWGLDIANMYVFLGETGDTIYEDMIRGMHKTLILRGIIYDGSEKMGGVLLAMEEKTFSLHKIQI